MTTIRYTEGELKKLISVSDKLLYGYSLEDKAEIRLKITEVL